MKARIYVLFSTLLLSVGLVGVVSSFQSDYSGGVQATTSPELNNWDYDFSNGASGSVSTTGAYIVIDVDAAGGADWHAKLARYSQTVSPDYQYRWTVRAKASTPIKANFIVNPGELASGWNVVIGTSFNSFTHAFIPGSTLNNVEYLFQFGGNWDENKVAGGFQITIESLKIERFAFTQLFIQDFSSGLGNFVSTEEAPADATLSHDATNERLSYQIHSYNVASEAWRLRLQSGSTGVNVTQGVIYRFDADIALTGAKNYELGIEDYRYDWQYRAGFADGQLAASTTHIYMPFAAAQSLNDIHVNFQLGQYVADVSDSSQTIYLDNVRLSVLSDTVDSTDETRVGKFTAEFATELADYDTCASGENGYDAVPTLKANFYDRLLDPEAMSTTMVTDYDYTFGEGSGEKVSNAVSVYNKWVKMVEMYNANNGENPDITLFGATPPVASFRFTKTISSIVIISVVSITSLSAYYFLKSKRSKQ